ncbi:MAG: B12-binding domain-containing radical SAM protein [Promethearchaeota archaeon]
MTPNEKNILFVIPGYSFIEDYQKMLYYNDIPLGTLQLSALLKEKASVRTNIVDMRIESEREGALTTHSSSKNGLQKAILRVMENKGIDEFDNLGINCYTSYQYLYTKILADIIKESYPDKKIIVGGYHSTAVPEDFNFIGSPFDYVIRGEADLILLDLFARDELNKRRQQEFPRELISNEVIKMEAIPFPDYHLYLDQYPNRNDLNFEFYMSRGCPYQCAFCATNYPFRSMGFNRFKVQFEKFRKIVEEKNRKQLKIGFSDQAFCSVPIQEKVLDYIQKNGYNDQFIFSCQSRIETVAKDSKLLKKLRKNGFIVGFGFEAASNYILKEMHKTDAPYEYVSMTLKILNEYKNTDGPYCRLNIVAGFPGETQESFNKTIDFIYQNALDENIQISPSLFSNYPNVFVYKNMEYYEQKFGTQFVREWWKTTENQFKKSVPKPSKSYSLKQLIYDYKTKYISILKLFKRNTFANLMVWKRFYNKWYDELENSLQ